MNDSVELYDHIYSRDFARWNSADMLQAEFVYKGVTSSAYITGQKGGYHPGSTKYFKICHMGVDYEGASFKED